MKCRAELISEFEILDQISWQSRCVVSHVNQRVLALAPHVKHFTQFIDVFLSLLGASRNNTYF